MPAPDEALRARFLAAQARYCWSKPLGATAALDSLSSALEAVCLDEKHGETQQKKTRRVLASDSDEEVEERLNEGGITAASLRGVSTSRRSRRIIESEDEEEERQEAQGVLRRSRKLVDSDEDEHNSNAEDDSGDEVSFEANEKYHSGEEGESDDSLQDFIASSEDEAIESTESETEEERESYAPSPRKTTRGTGRKKITASKSDMLWEVRSGCNNDTSEDDDSESDADQINTSSVDHDKRRVPRPVAAKRNPKKPPKAAAVRPQTRDKLVAENFAHFNREVFGNELPPIEYLPVTWNAKLRKTAGLTYTSRGKGSGGNRPFVARIELATKVIDTEEKLRQTLLHEMCHAAAWVLDRTCKPPHGPVFKKWARRGTRQFPNLEVSTCHNYEIFYKFRWKCSNEPCGIEFGRHSNSIDVSKQACGKCHARLVALGSFKKDGTPIKKRAPSAYSLFVKQHFASVKQEHPHAKHGWLMTKLGQMWKEKQQTECQPSTEQPARQPSKLQQQQPVREGSSPEIQLQPSSLFISFT
jgi:predicted SprT family Zn-dependent metalloprotease